MLGFELRDQYLRIRDIGLRFLDSKLTGRASDYGLGLRTYDLGLRSSVLRFRVSDFGIRT